MNGTVIRTKLDRGFGFIMGEDGEEYFFHMSALKNDSINNLREGHQVKFEATKTPKGNRAEQVYV
jgi:CspA family cold shock protein